MKIKSKLLEASFVLSLLICIHIVMNPSLVTICWPENKTNEKAFWDNAKLFLLIFVFSFALLTAMVFSLRFILTKFIMKKIWIE